MQLFRFAIAAMVLGTPPQEFRNLVRNGDASMALSGWEARRQASVEGTGPAAHFVVRNQGEFVQTIDLPPSAAGQFVAVVGRGASDRVNADGSITGLPYLYGLFGDASGRRFLGYLQGQQMRLHASRAAEWAVMSGTFQIPAGTARLILRLSQASRRGDPQNGSAARFDDVGVYVFPTEAPARAFIADWRGMRAFEPLAPPADSSTVTPFVREWAVVLPEAEGFKVAHPCSRYAPAQIMSVWRPDPAAIGRFEQALAPLVQGALERSPLLRKPAWSSDSYYRQYVGVVVNGRRLVYVNAFRPIGGRLPQSWEIQLVNACDGGELFFGAEFDVETGRVQNLAFNSPR
jgi:hypothetical protein